MPVRVAIVDDDLWVRTGRAEILSQDPRVDVIAVLGHAEALEQTALWDTVDVVVVDAWDHRAGFDRFPGVGVVRAIRRHSRDSPPTIIVVTGHVVNEMLRVRMAEAGADFFYGHEDVFHPDRLLAVILDPGPVRPLPGTGSAGGPLHPDAALDWIGAYDVEDAFSGQSQKTLPMSRRAVAHIRREVSVRAGLGGPPSLPRWRRVVDFVNRARGADLPAPGAGSGAGEQLTQRPD